MGVVSTTNSTPPDKVASVILGPPLYISYNLSCNMSGSTSSLMYDRYLLCNTITNMCTCPPMTYWNGNICMNQGYTGSRCTSAMPMCRLDLNLSCASGKCGKSERRYQIGMQRTRTFGFEFDYSDHFMKSRPKYYAKNDLRTNQSESFMKSIIRKSDVLRPVLKLASSRFVTCLISYSQNDKLSKFYDLNTSFLSISYTAYNVQSIILSHWYSKMF